MSTPRKKKLFKPRIKLQVWLSEIERERLEAIASSRNLSLSELVRYWINNGGWRSLHLEYQVSQETRQSLTADQIFDIGEVAIMYQISQETRQSLTSW